MQAMKVLQFICPTGFYGAERWVLALGNNIDPKSVQCDLAVTAEGGGEQELVKHYRNLGLQVHEIPMRNRFDLSAVKALAKLLKEEQYDIIHTHGYKSDIIGVMAAKMAGITSVCTPHGFENSDDIKLRTFIWLGCQSMRFFDAVAPLSKQLCKDVTPYGVKPSKLHYIQNGVDLKEVFGVKDDDAVSADTDKKRIGFIGQMISRKNIRDILDVFDTLHQTHPDTELYLLGDGDERASLERHAETLRSKEDIHFLGFRQDRLELLKSFDLFVMTSSLEGIPRCLMETMAMGIPVAAYDIPGIDQLVDHQKTGLLAPFGEKDTLLRLWEEALYNDDLSQALSEQGTDFVNSHFSAQRMANDYTELFKELTR